MAAAFDLTKTSNQQYLFNLRAANGEIVFTSETYEAKQSALDGIAAVRVNAAVDTRYERQASGTQYYFTLSAANHEVLGTSERYTSTAARETGIASVKANAPAAPVRDRT